MKMNRTSALALAVILSGLLLGCDYFKTDKPPTDKPNKLSPEKKLEFAEKCSKVGKEYFDSYIASNLPNGFLWDEPEYHYSSRLNSCLVHIRYVGNAGDSYIHKNQVIDVFANKVLLRGHFERDKNNSETLSTTHDDVPNFTSTEYFKRKDELFSE